VAATVIFALTYVAIAAGRLPLLGVDRPTAALCGAVAMVALGGLELDDAMAAIDLHVIALLLGVMIIAAYLRQAHFFRFGAWWVLTRARSARSLLWSLVFVAGGLSALLVNDTVCVVLTPLVVAVALEAKLPPLPYLFALAASTNVGGVVSFTGNPQNMLIGRAAAGEPSFAEYMVLALPIGAASLAVIAALLVWLFRSSLPRGPLGDRTTPRPYLDRGLCVRALAALGAFVGLALAGFSLAGSALAAAAVLIAISRVSPREALQHVDWPLLLMFAGLFVLVRGWFASGALGPVLAAVEHGLGEGVLGQDLPLAAISVAASNVVSNVPFVAIAVEWIDHLSDPRWGWVVLAVASTLAGNLTLFGSVANVIVFESAGPRGKIGFLGFLRVGIVLTAATLAVALVIVSAERALGL
jgi:Na+/H+ antiporter NhaD/arsenite permease-like protein